jgi:CBS domain-containing protein
MLKASDIMTEDVATIRGSATVAEAVKLMKLKNLRALVVETRNGQDAYGILTQADIAYKVIARGTDPTKVRVYQIMTKPCIVVNPDLGVEYVARLFANTDIHMAPVISGELLGIVSISDIIYKGDYLENPKEFVLKNELERAIEEAKSLCETQGANSQTCLAAWALVDELETEAAYQDNAKSIEKTAFEEFCEAHPEVLHVRHDQVLAGAASS